MGHIKNAQMENEDGRTGHSTNPYWSFSRKCGTIAKNEAWPMLPYQAHPAESPEAGVILLMGLTKNSCLWVSKLSPASTLGVTGVLAVGYFSIPVNLVKWALNRACPNYSYAMSMAQVCHIGASSEGASHCRFELLMGKGIWPTNYDPFNRPSELSMHHYL